MCVCVLVGGNNKTTELLLLTGNTIHLTIKYHLERVGPHLEAVYYGILVETPLVQ